MSAFRVKRTCRLHCEMSANDPKRTFCGRRVGVLSRVLQTNICHSAINEPAEPLHSHLIVRSKRQVIISCHECHSRATIHICLQFFEPRRQGLFRVRFPLRRRGHISSNLAGAGKRGAWLGLSAHALLQRVKCPARSQQLCRRACQLQQIYRLPPAFSQAHRKTATAIRQVGFLERKDAGKIIRRGERDRVIASHRNTAGPSIASIIRMSAIGT
jgi:hypothetical protein